MRKSVVDLILPALMTGLVLSTPAHAGNQALFELLKALHENGTIDAQTYELVSQVAEQDDKVPSTENVKEEIKEAVSARVEEVAKDQPKVNTKGKFTVESKEGDFRFRVGGRLQVDAATYSEDNLRHNDGTELRRARLFATGTLWHDWNYKLQYDFVSTGISGLQDAYIEYAGYKPWKFRAGHFKEPFSLQNMTSSKYVTFTERGLPHLFAPGRNIGLAANTYGKNWSLAAGVFGEGRDGASSDHDEGYGASARVTFAPVLNDTQLLHLGGAVSHRVTGSGDSVRFRERPESHMTDRRLVDTGTISTDDYTRLVAETAMFFGPIALQGEYYYLTLNRATAATSDPDFSGYYVESSWFLTGESPNYKPKSGNFVKITPNGVVGKGGFGAWQLAMRFSSLDLNDAGINGGEEENLTFGLNWYTTPNIRLSANYVKVLDVEKGTSAGDKPDIFQMRAQVEF